MRLRPIGYYVHHHGAGHRARADAIASAIDWPVVLLGTGIGGAGIDLPDDRPRSKQFDGADDAVSRPDALHYAPIDHRGVRERVARMTSWIAAQRPVMMIIDVSAEVAMLARLASVPTIYVRLNGRRNDVAHLDAFRGATGLLTPFHQSLEPSGIPSWVRNKSFYCPGIAAPPVTSPGPANSQDARRVLVIFGKGGAPSDGQFLSEAAAACPDWEWRAIGPVTAPLQCPPNLVLAGWVQAPEREIAQSSIVVGAAGDGVVGAVMAADKPFICIPQTRPYDEQRVTAQGLSALGAALVLQQWPHPASWPELLEEGVALKPAARALLSDVEGARKAATWLAQCAANVMQQQECKK